MYKEKISEEERLDFKGNKNKTNCVKEYDDDDHTKVTTDKMCHNDSSKSFKELRKIMGQQHVICFFHM